MLTSFLFFLAFGAAATAIVWSAVQLFAVQEDPLDERMAQLRTFTATGPAETGGPRRRSSGGSFWNQLLYIVSRFGGEEWIREVERDLRAAGLRKPESAAYYVFGHSLFFVVCIGGMLWLQRDNPISNAFGGLIAAFIIGWLVPKIVLSKLAKRYKARLQEALPDTIDLLGIVLGTGLALDQAMVRVSEEMQFIYPELANEFYTVVMQVKAGQDRAKAFNQLVRRTGIEDIKSLAAMIIQSERFGTSLAHALKVYADALRMRRRLRAEAANAKAGIKMLFPIIIFILPVLFAITLGPAMITVLRSLAGGIGQR